jgi:hypothetical protein
MTMTSLSRQHAVVRFAVPAAAFAALCAGGVVGCANSPAPQSIGARHVSNIPYLNLTCSQLRQEQSSLDAALASASAQEEKIRSNERVQSALSVLSVVPIVGMLPSLLGGSASSNSAAQEDIEQLKGEQEAVRQAVGRNSCPT